VKKRLLAVQFALDDEDEEEEGVVADVAPTVDEASKWISFPCFFFFILIKAKF